jgi:hypothetical protein
MPASNPTLELGNSGVVSLSSVARNLGYYSNSWRYPFASDSAVSWLIGSNPLEMTVYVAAPNAGAADAAATISTPIHIAGTNGNVQLDGYTKLGGANAPSIRMKKVTGTTAGAEGTPTNIPHGLPGSKILGIHAKVEHAPDSGMTPGHVTFAGYQYDAYWNATNVVVYIHATNSENILNKNISVLIIYEE